MIEKVSLSEFEKNTNTSYPRNRLPKDVADILDEIENIFSDFLNTIESYDISDADIVWHYTSTDSLYKILTGNSIHLGEAIYMNDPKEGEVLVDVLKKLYGDSHGDYLEDIFSSFFLNDDRYPERIRNDIIDMYSVKGKRINPFLLSFSESSDSLEQWRLYGDNAKGAAIGIKISDLKDKYIFDTPLRLAKVRYQKEEANDFAASLFDMYLNFRAILEDKYKYPSRLKKTSLSYLNKLAFKVINDFKYFFKHDSYKNESEYRIIIDPDFESKVEYEYKVRDSSIYEAAILKGEFFEGAKLPICAIKFGPLHNLGPSRRFIKAGPHPYGDVDILFSDVPYRG